jgi:ribokinase
LSELDILIANEIEAAQLGTEAARRLRRGLVVTRGAAGAETWLPDGSHLAVPVLPVAPIDTTGAGDTFVGVLAAGLDMGLPLDHALRRASAAAGLACLARGAQAAMPDAAAIDEATARLPSPAAAGER